MKWMHLFVFFLLGALMCNGDEETKDLNNDNKDDTKDIIDSDFLEKIKNNMKHKCKATGADDALNRVDDVFDEVVFCTLKLAPEDTNIITDANATKQEKNEFCSEKRKAAQECLKGPIQLWEDCAKPEEIYVAGFLLEAYDSAADYLCEGDFIEIVFTEVSRKCAMALFEEESKTAIDCIDKVTELIDDMQNMTVIKKSDLCRNLKDIIECSTLVVHQLCPDNATLGPALAGLFEAVSSPCNKRRR